MFFCQFEVHVCTNYCFLIATMVDFITIHVHVHCPCEVLTYDLHVHSSFTITATLLIQRFNDFSH